jgi:hypothetical protein
MQSARACPDIRWPEQPAGSKIGKSRVVGVAGFEPATPSSRTRCATRLRYTPRPTRGRFLTALKTGLQASRGPPVQLFVRKDNLPRFRPCGSGIFVSDRLKPGRGGARRFLQAVGGYRPGLVGASPRGKAADFDSAIPRFESWRPSQIFYQVSDIVGITARQFRQFSSSCTPDSTRSRTQGAIKLPLCSHLYRRGAMYWWRRRLVCPDGTTIVALSLNEREPSRAISLAIAMTAASEDVRQLYPEPPLVFGCHLV